MTTIDALIRRRSPDAEATWARYSVRITSRTTVLDVLTVISEELDSSLAFRAECRSGICGACAGLVNGVPRLFCATFVEDVVASAASSTAGAPLVIEPLPPFPVLKDLVVDLRRFYEGFKRSETWVEPAATYSGLLPPGLAEQLTSAAKCILCAICAHDAPAAVPEPAVAARLMRVALDPRDGRGETRLLSLGESDPRHHLDSLATHLQHCCPAGVDLRAMVTTGGNSAARVGDQDGPRDDTR